MKNDDDFRWRSNLMFQAQRLMIKNTRLMFVMIAIVALALVFLLIEKNDPIEITPEMDREIATIVLADFKNWKDVTFGNFEGVLEVQELTRANPTLTQEDVMLLANEVAHHLNKEAIRSFIKRNEIAQPVDALILGVNDVLLRKQTVVDGYEYEMSLPDGVKSTGSLTMPGYGEKGLFAMIQINHRWGEHGAIVTYALSKKSGKWQIIGRGQIVFI